MRTLMIWHNSLLHYALENSASTPWHQQFQMFCESARFMVKRWGVNDVVREPFATCLRCLGMEHQRGKLLEEYEWPST